MRPKSHHYPAESAKRLNLWQLWSNKHGLPHHQAGYKQVCVGGTRCCRCEVHLQAPPTLSLHTLHVWHLPVHARHVWRIIGPPTSRRADICFPPRALNYAPPHLLSPQSQAQLLKHTAHMAHVRAPTASPDIFLAGAVAPFSFDRRSFSWKKTLKKIYALNFSGLNFLNHIPSWYTAVVIDLTTAAASNRQPLSL